MYHYKESGLRNVWLADGYEIVHTPHGKGISFDDIDALHAAIGRMICSHSPRLSGPEVRFLRGEMALSQAALARLLGNNAQSVALWEKSRVKVPKWADRLLRALYREHTGESVKIRALIEKVEEAEARPAPRIEAVKSRGGWKLKAA